MLKLCRVAKVKVFFLVLVYVFNFDLFKFSATILEKGLLTNSKLHSVDIWVMDEHGRLLSTDETCENFCSYRKIIIRLMEGTCRLFIACFFAGSYNWICKFHYPFNVFVDGDVDEARLSENMIPLTTFIFEDWLKIMYVMLCRTAHQQTRA